MLLHLIFNAAAAGDNIIVHREDILHRKPIRVTGYLMKPFYTFLRIISFIKTSGNHIK
jgi:hypothetical protein